MRRDMKKLLVKRPRIAGYSKVSYSNSTKQKRIYSNTIDNFCIKYESMRRPHISGFSGKYQNDYLKPLVRFLQSRVGRPWNQIWSEICRSAGKHGILSYHLKQHVKAYVGGIPHSNGSFFNTEKKGEPGGMNSPVYVDKQGILRKNNHYKG